MFSAWSGVISRSAVSCPEVGILSYVSVLSPSCLCPAAVFVSVSHVTVCPTGLRTFAAYLPLLRLRLFVSDSPYHVWLLHLGLSLVSLPLVSLPLVYLTLVSLSLVYLPLVSLTLVTLTLVYLTLVSLPLVSLTSRLSNLVSNPRLSNPRLSSL